MDPEPLFWLEKVKKRNPRLIPTSHDWWGAYKSYLEKEQGFESQRKAADTLGISRRTLRDHFESIAGAIKSLMGSEFEPVMAQLYQSERECVHCGAIFFPRNDNQKYCSYDCRMDAQNQRDRELRQSDPESVNITLS